MQYLCALKIAISLTLFLIFFSKFVALQALGLRLTY